MMDNSPPSRRLSGLSWCAMRSVGTDIVEIARIGRSLRRQPAFAAEVFSADERSYCDAQARPEQHYAARFAAKEAFLKAVGRGVLDGVALDEIEVTRSGDRAPAFRLGPTARAALTEAGGREALVSLSHDGGVALAFVVVCG
jgi:holo-[acyl-carrier protein] synthase